MWLFIGSLLSGVMEGGGGLAASQLTADHTAIVTELDVANTEGFLKSSYVHIGNEKIRYRNKDDNTFLNCTRAWDDTVADSYTTGTRVYSPDAEIINAALGFNIASTGATVGVVNIPMIIGNFFTVTLPRLILWDYSWLKTSQWLQLLRYMFMGISVGFLMYLAYHIAMALGGILQRIFVR